jgi:class 3 adenylate cyclase/DNA-binding CsgD family transcriptional regulator
MTVLPSGAVTFLFSDIEGSTRLVKALRGRYPQMLAEHRDLFRAAIADHAGYEVDTQGDAFFVAFAAAKQAVRCALQVQRALAAHQWPDGGRVRVRMGIHTGHSVPAGGAYAGLAVHRAARICAAARGGQVLVSQATQTLIEDEEEELEFTLVEVGEYRLKDLDRPARLFQLAAPGLGAPAGRASPIGRELGAGTVIEGMLTGREPEQRQIDQLLQRAGAGSSGVLVLRGDPGIGKTALIDYAAGRAGEMRALRATGIEAENELGFAGLYSLLYPVAGYLTALPDRQAAALRAALGLGYDQAVPSAPDRLAVAAGTHSLLTTAAEDRPLLILVDDLHWVDPASQEALLFALRRLGQDAVACLVTMRAGPAAPAGLPCQELTGLGRDAAERLVEAIAGTRPVRQVASRLHAETGGNPLALVELSAALTAAQLGGAGLPDAPLEPGTAIRQRFAARLDRLSPPTRTALVVAAAAGRCAVAEVDAAVARLGNGGSNAFDEAEIAGLVCLINDRVEFSHPLLRSVAYHVAGPAQRRAAHQALAETLAGRDAERAAWHLAAAAIGPDQVVAEALDAAAAAAARKGAPVEAAAAWERAAELSAEPERRAGRLAEAAEAAFDGGDLDRVRRLTRAMPAAEQRFTRARMLAVRGRLALLTGQMAVAHGELAEAADLAADGDPLLAVELLDQAVSAGLEAGLYDEASRAAERMAGLAERSDETAKFLADLAYGGLAWLRGEADQGMAMIRRAMSTLEANPALASRPERQLDLASAWCDAGRPDRAWPCANRAVELARSEGAAGRLPRALAWAAWLDGEGGRWSRALAYGSQALDLALATGQSYLACYAYATVANVEAAQGRDDDCLRHANGAEQLAAELGLRKLEVQARRSRALLDLGRGRLDEAIARYEELRRLTAEWGIAHPYYSTIPDLIEAYARIGALDQARALLPKYLASVPGQANPQSAARAARCRGIAAADDFDTHFLEAIALHERGDVVFQHARTHLVYGERLRRAQRRRDARVQLRAAAEIFDRLDARPWAERARAELRASGETLASGGDGTVQLTPQELQIAQLVTEGRTNAEVGRALFLSTRTVEFHLSRAYRKLGVASRTELTRRLATTGTAAG